VFAQLARHEAEAFDLPSFPILIVPHPLATRSAEEIHRIGADLAEDALRALTETGDGS
jgi:hypothetical protein